MSWAVLPNHFLCSCSRFAVTRWAFVVRYCSWLLASSRAEMASSTLSRLTLELAFSLSAAESFDLV